MNSDIQARRCYVYITLPGQSEAVTAGLFELTTDRHGIPVGRFVYGKSYRERPGAVSIDPVELRLAPGTFTTTKLGGIFGALRDAGPDYWGRQIIERSSGSVQLGELDYLLNSPDDRAGALGFGPDLIPAAKSREFNQTLNLGRLQKLADIIIREEERPDHATAIQIEDLLLLRTSMGGARPKAIVEDGNALWIAKFNRPDDRWNSARVEQSMLTLGRAGGFATAESKVVSVAGRDVLLVKRFDREQSKNGYLRARMVSGLTLLRAEDSHRSRDQWSYLLLGEEIRRVCAEPRNQANELFRRMCFNALISNTDDHPRNHAILARNQEWILSPAYDLTPSTPISLEHRDLALVCGDHGRFANAENLLSQCERFLVNRGAAEAIMKNMEEHVRRNWYRVARSEGVSERDCGAISGAFAYPGFRF